jgi:flagellar basal-body rod protein FlgB
MFIKQLLFSDRAPKVLRKSLDFQSQRHLLISSNISNLDTPGYKAKDIDFKSQLVEVMGRGNELKMNTTMGPSMMALKGLQPLPFVLPDAAKSNGNNVNIDKEMMKLAENQIDFNATIQLINKRSSTIRAAIVENAQ